MDTRLKVLAGKAREGDHEAFAALYAKYAKELYAYALVVLGDAYAAQDAVQDAVLAAFQKAPALRDPAAFKHWLFRILANTCRLYLRKHGRDKSCASLEEMIDSGVFDAGLAAKTPDLTLSLTLRQALAELTPQERQIVLLHVYGGCKSYEIADCLACPAGTVRSKLKRSLQKLRHILEDEQTPPERSFENYAEPKE